MSFISSCVWKFGPSRWALFKKIMKPLGLLERVGKGGEPRSISCSYPAPQVQMQCGLPASHPTLPFLKLNLSRPFPFCHNTQGSQEEIGAEKSSHCCGKSDRVWQSVWRIHTLWEQVSQEEWEKFAVQAKTPIIYKQSLPGHFSQNMEDKNA